ncbi:MAG: TonB-dependent receptor [Thermodesulfovibrionales bacterium]|nr:TonB-dependent receptor [Thermodesulfovibrionales bacterium]
MNRLWFILLPFLMISSAWAEEKAKLEEIVVSAARLQESIEETTSDVIVIRDDEIKKMNVQFIPDVLRKVPELNLVQNGGPGTAAAVLLRGGSSAHTLIMIDGIKVNNTATGSFDFSGIKVDDIERIEIVKGPQSTIYGSEAMAGVINIITKKGQDKPGIDLSFDAGSYGTYNPALTVSGAIKAVDYRLSTSYFSTDGISAAKNGEERDGYRNASISGKFGIRPSEKLEVEITGKYSYDRTELDGFDFFASEAVDDLNFVQRGNHTMLSGKAKLCLSSTWEHIITLSHVGEVLTFRDPDTDFNNADIVTAIDSIDWQHNFYISDNYILTTGAEYRKESGENKGNFDKSLDNKALYLNNKLKLLQETLVVNAGLRYDDHETFGNKTTYRFGALYNIKHISLILKGSYGTGFRAPALNELFFPFYGSKNLKSEETTSWEIGLEKGIVKDRVSVSLTYFSQNFENLIDTDPLTFTAANIAKAEVKGFEAGAILKMSANLNIKAGYTYLDTKDKTTGQRLSLRPKDKLSVSAEFSAKDISVVADYIFVGQRYDSSVKRDLSSYSLLNLSSNFVINKWLTIFARINNLFDADYEEAGGYGTPGFSAYGGMRVSL